MNFPVVHIITVYILKCFHLVNYAIFSPTPCHTSQMCEFLRETAAFLRTRLKKCEHATLTGAVWATNVHFHPHREADQRGSRTIVWHWKRGSFLCQTRSDAISLTWRQEGMHDCKNAVLHLLLIAPCIPEVAAAHCFTVEPTCREGWRFLLCEGRIRWHSLPFHLTKLARLALIFSTLVAAQQRPPHLKPSLEVCHVELSSTTIFWLSPLLSPYSVCYLRQLPEVEEVGGPEWDRETTPGFILNFTWSCSVRNRFRTMDSICECRESPCVNSPSNWHRRHQPQLTASSHLRVVLFGKKLLLLLHTQRWKQPPPSLSISLLPFNSLSFLKEWKLKRHEARLSLSGTLVFLILFQAPFSQCAPVSQARL